MAERFEEAFRGAERIEATEEQHEELTSVLDRLQAVVERL